MGGQVKSFQQLVKWAEHTTTNFVPNSRTTTRRNVVGGYVAEGLFHQTRPDAVWAQQNTHDFTLNGTTIEIKAKIAHTLPKPHYHIVVTDHSLTTQAPDVYVFAHIRYDQSGWIGGEILGWMERTQILQFPHYEKGDQPQGVPYKLYDGGHLIKYSDLKDMKDL